MHQGVYEILDEVSKTRSKAKKIELLRTKHNKTLETIVDLCYNPRFTFLLPEGAPPYKPQPKMGDHQGALTANLRKLKIFVNSVDYQNIKPHVRETQFVQFIETIDPDDAELLIHIKDNRDLPWKNINQKLFDEAWPALASTWRTEDTTTE